MIVKCTRCGKEVQEDAEFCQHCGVKFTRTEYTCEKCGKKIDKDADFCPHCGTDFNLPQRQCGQCGKFFNGYPKFCPYCGVKFQKLNDEASKKRRKAKVKGWFALVLVPLLIAGMCFLRSNRDVITDVVVSNVNETNREIENMRNGSEDPEDVIEAFLITIINKDTAHIEDYLDLYLKRDLTELKELYMSEDYSDLDFNSAEIEMLSEYKSSSGWKCREYSVTVLDKAKEYRYSFTIIIHENPETKRWYYSAPK